MPGVATEVAALEAETAEAVSAATVAQVAASQAVASADALQDQLTANNAETVREWSDDLARNKEHIEWMTKRLSTLEASQETTTVEVLALREQLSTLSTSALARQPAPEPNPAEQLPSSVVAVDLPAVAPPEPPPSRPPKPKRYKRL